MAKARDRRRTLDGFAEINHDATGIDVGNAQHWVAVPAGRDAESVRMFGCFTADLHALANWLERCGIKTVALESTGVYWIALYEVLESRGFKVCVVKRSSSQEPARTQDGCKGLSVVATIAYLRVISRIVPATGGDHHPASLSPTSRNAGAGSSNLHPAHSEGTHGDESTAS